MATWTNKNKNTSTFKNILKHGSPTLLRDLADFTFEDVVFNDGVELKDIKFSELVEQVWSTVSKNNASWTNKSKN